LFLSDLMYMAELAGTDGWDDVRKYANCHLRDIELSTKETWDLYKSNKDMLFMMEQSGSNSKAAWKKPGGTGRTSEEFFPKTKSASTEMKSFTCKRWNNGTCSSQSDHVTNKILWHHQCGACLKKGTVSSHVAQTND
jgi:hypothetical protein